MHALLLGQMDLLNGLNSKEARADYAARYGDRAEERLEEDRDRVLKGELFVDVDEGKRKELGFASFQIEANIIQLLLGMKMTVVDCHFKSFFLTSDNPVVRTFPSNDSAHDDEMWFPVSYTRAILWHRRDLPSRQKLGHSETRNYNRRTIRFAYKFVFSPFAESWIETACREATFSPLFGHYGSLEEVIAKSQKTSDGREIVNYIAAMREGKHEDILGI